MAQPGRCLKRTRPSLALTGRVYQCSVTQARLSRLQQGGLRSRMAKGLAVDNGESLRVCEWGMRRVGKSPSKYSHEGMMPPIEA
jgi:hypothetical protein